MNVEQQRLIRCGFNEVVAGYTPLQFRECDLYIKHFGARDQIEVDAIYKSHLDKLKKKGVPTSEEKAEQLLKDGLWTDEDERALVAKQREIEDLKSGKKLIFIKSQIDRQQQEIDRAEGDYLDTLMRKNGLFGKTAEFFANKRVSDFCVVNSIFKDAQFKAPYFSRDDMFDLDDETMDDVSTAYNAAMAKFDELNLKRVALAPLFQNYYYLAKSVYEFYGRAIVDLTFYQIQLATFGDHYKTVLYSGENPPPYDVVNDPEKLDDWLHGSSHAKKLVETTLGKDKGEGEGSTFTTIVGAKKEDLDYLGMKEDKKAVTLNSLVKEKGGHLTMKDLMALQGIK